MVFFNWSCRRLMGVRVGYQPNCFVEITGGMIKYIFVSIIWIQMEKNTKEERFFMGFLGFSLNEPTYGGWHVPLILINN